MTHTQQGKIIVASDFHYGLGKNSKTKLQILKEFVEPEILKEISCDSKPTTVVICGDLFHEMVSVRTDIYAEAKSFLKKCAEMARVIVVVGNHDCFNDTTDVTSVSLFEQLNNIEIISDPKIENIYGLDCLFLPWCDNNETAFSQNLKDETFDCVFCHPDVPKEFFSGLYILENSRRVSATEKNKRKIDEETLLKSDFTDISFSNGTRNDSIVSNLESVRKVITLAKKNGEIYAGHIHKHSESFILGRLFKFIGSPYQTTSEEMDTKSGFYTIDENGSRFQEIRSPEYVKVRFSDVKKSGAKNYDCSRIAGNIIQFDGDDLLTVEEEHILKKRILDSKPFEVSETDYSNLILDAEPVKDSEKYQKAFAASPRSCIGMFIDSIPDETFEKEKVDREKLKTMFFKFYDTTDRKIGFVESDGGAHINYKSITAENFLSYEKLEFDFMKYSGLTLVYGRNLDNIGATNACGKSNILKAISYGLFGRFPKKVKKENMIPWTGDSRDVCVTIRLETNGVNYRIESGMKKGKDSFHRVINEDTGEDLTKKQLAETRKFIETEILHCGFDMFMKTTILTSSEIFNFYAMKKEDKDDYLNTIFGTKTLMEVGESVKIEIKRLRALLGERSRLYESKDHDIELNLEASEKFEEGRKENIAKINAEIDGLNIKIEELKEADTPENKEFFIKKREELELVDKKLTAANKKIYNLRDKHVSLSKAIQKDETTISILKQEGSKHKDVVPKLCDKCKKIAADGYKLTDYAKTIKDAKTRLETNKDHLKEIADEIEKLSAERDSLAGEYMKIDSEMRNSRSHAAEIGKIEVMIESKRSTLDFISKQTNPNTKIIEALQKDKEVLEDETDRISSQLCHMSFLQTKVISQDVVINLLTSKFIRQLNDRIRYYLQRLGLNLGVEFDNYFQYEFVRGDGIHPEFNSLSGGESLRIVIATSFAFKDFLESRRNISSNIRFLDEFFEKDTDNLGMNSTIAILKDFSKIMKQNVFLVSNKLNEIDNSVFDNILVVNIKDNKSFIEEEKIGK